jgi:glycerol uptake facilitator-like aquaporin
MQSYIKTYIVELVATFLFTFLLGMLIIGGAPNLAPYFAGLLLAFLVYTLSGHSQVHVNPMITLAMGSLGKMSLRDTLGYLVAQFVGAALSLLAIRGLIAGAAERIANLQSVATITMQTGIAEAIGAFFFAWGISALVSRKESPATMAFLAGVAMLLGIIAAAISGSLGIINPALALTLGVFNPMYVVAPVVGGVLGVWAYAMLTGGIPKKKSIVAHTTA